MSGPVFFLNGCLGTAPPNSIDRHPKADAQPCQLYYADDLSDSIVMFFRRLTMQTGVESAM